MNNEPVAWMGKDYDGLKTDLYFDVEKNKLPYRLYESAVPLYTHPVKEQDTDCQYCKQGCIRCDARKQLTDEEILDLASYAGENPTKYDMIDFARAILRKAQEQ
jgi:hypothetical protein